MIIASLFKLKIIAYKSSSFTELAGSGVFLAQVNPENYSVAYSVENDRTQASGTSGHDATWVRNAPKRLSLDFFFDGTGAIPGVLPTGESDLENTFDTGFIQNDALNLDLDLAPELSEAADQLTSHISVEPQIKYFENTIFGYQGTIHQPNSLIINWGSLVFKCRLENMTINYKLFSPEGLPLRATVTASFIELVNEKERNAIEKKESADITHARTVIAGDTLPGLAKLIYGNESYYIRIAQANNLIHFRNLVPGQQIIFPPIAKGEKKV